MKAREKYNQLISARDAEINEVTGRYADAIESCFTKIALDELISDGWKRGSYYPAGSSDESGHMYYYNKGNHSIMVNEKSNDIQTMLGDYILDMEDLNDYSSK